MTTLARWTVTGLALALASTALGSAQSARAATTPSTLTVTLGGDGAGTITSDTGGVDCSAGTCTAPFDPAASVTLTATSATGSAFTGFGGGTCTGLTCTVLMSADRTVTADFDRRPTITAPADGTAYSQASLPAAGYGCAAGDTSCTATLDGAATPIGNGDPLAATPGAHTLTVSGVAADGATVTQTAAYGVVAPLVGGAPEVVVTAPVDNAAYVWTAIPAADFACIAGVGSAVQSCRATVAGQPVSDHQALPNGFGAHVLTVTATDADGLSSTVNVTYTVRSASAAPPVTIRAPAQGASYRLGQAVAARYSCLATSSGPALRSCIGTVPAGRPIDTGTLGRHPFSVSARNAQGDSTTETVSYRVVPTTNRFAVARIRATSSGAARLALKLPGPGSVRVLAMAWNAAAGASARHVAYGTASVGARRGGPLSLVIRPTGAGRALLRKHGARPVIALAVTYTPTGARPRVLHPELLRLRRASRPTGRR
ncbi:MAG TPA: hypothetical protein VNV17_18700 [Solirubrobacteraceae bacterium]|nr:hypothetical protein [Solirubrobacteraceae bacterium]